MGQHELKTGSSQAVGAQATGFAEALTHAAMLLSFEGQMLYANALAYDMLNLDENITANTLYQKLNLPSTVADQLNNLRNYRPETPRSFSPVRSSVVSKASRIMNVEIYISFIPSCAGPEQLILIQLVPEKVISIPTLESSRQRMAARDAYSKHEGKIPQNIEEATARIALLEKELNRWKFATEANNTGIWEWNVADNRLTISEICSQHLGYTKPLQIHTPEDWEQLIYPEDLARVRALWHSVLQGNTEHYSTEYRVRHARGNYVWISDRGRAIEKTPEGKAYLVQGTHENVHEKVLQRNALSAVASKLKGENQVLASDNDALTLSNKALANYAYVASHDLQSPLRKIHQFIDLFANKYAPLVDETGQRYIQNIQRTAGQMRSLIDDLLAYSRLQVEREEVEPVDLQGIVNDLADDFISQDPFVRIVVEGPLPVVKANRSQMVQLFQNLVGNGIKYNRNIEKHISIDAKTGAEGTVVKVTDNGIGIAKEDQDKIFDLFVRLHGKNEFSGTGMGLAITKRVIDNIGGSISVESTPQKGSSFYVLFPSAAVVNTGVRP